MEPEPLPSSKQVQLLSNLIRCGACGSSFFAYRRYRTAERKTLPRYVGYKIAYRCNWRWRQRTHSTNTEIRRCYSKEIRAELLEAKVFEMIEAVMLEPNKLRKDMLFFRDDTRGAARRRARKVEQISAQLLDVEDRKKRIIDVYASGDLSRDAYIARNRAYDAEAIELRRRRAKLMQSTSLFDQRDAVDAGIAEVCDDARARFARCRDFAAKRQFLLDYVEKITFADDNVILNGSVPIRPNITGGRINTDAETSKLDFRISDRITPEEKLAARRQARAQRRKSAVRQILVPHPIPSAFQ